MGDDEIAFFFDGFVHHFFGNIKTYQRLAQFMLSIPNLQATIVVAFLKIKRNNFFKAFNKFTNFHAKKGLFNRYGFC